MITYKQRSRFKKTMKIPEAIQQNIEMEDENDIYWYVHLVNSELIISLSVNQRITYQTRFITPPEHSIEKSID